MLSLRYLQTLVISSLFAISGVVAQEQVHEHDHENDHEYGHEYGHEQHAAHVHGHAKLLVAVEGGVIEMMFETPAMNLLGFEHEPETPEQLSRVEQVLSELHKPEQLFTIPSSAACKLSKTEIEAPFQKNGTDGQHSDYFARYRFECGNPEEIQQISVHLLRRFPLTESLEVQSISPSGQKAFELTSGNNNIPLK